MKAPLPVGYRNVDLEIRSTVLLDPLLAVLAPHVFIAHDARVRGRSFAYLHLNDSGLDRTPEKTMGKWLALLASVRGPARTILRGSRVIASIGFDASEHSTTVVVAPETVAVLAKAGIGVEVVVYAAPKPTRRK